MRRWMDGCKDGCMDTCMDGWTDGWMDARNDARMDTDMHDWNKHGLMHRWMSAHMDRKT